MTIVGTVELTESGNLRVPSALAAEYLPADACLAGSDEGDLILIPLSSSANGGLVLKMRNPDGDRVVLVSEALHFQVQAGTFQVRWEEDRGALRVLMADANVPTTTGSA